MESRRSDSWLIEFLLNLDPEQIRAYGDAISEIIRAFGDVILLIGLLFTLNKLASNRKMAKYVKDVIKIIINGKIC